MNQFRYQIKNGNDNTIICSFEKLETAIKCCSYYKEYKPYIFDNEKYAYIYV